MREPLVSIDIRSFLSKWRRVRCLTIALGQLGPQLRRLLRGEVPTTLTTTFHIRPLRGRVLNVSVPKNRMASGAVKTLNGCSGTKHGRTTHIMMMYRRPYTRGRFVTLSGYRDVVGQTSLTPIPESSASAGSCRQLKRPSQLPVALYSTTPTAYSEEIECQAPKHRYREGQMAGKIHIGECTHGLWLEEGSVDLRTRLQV